MILSFQVGFLGLFNLLLCVFAGIKMADYATLHHLCWSFCTVRPYYHASPNPEERAKTRRNQATRRRWGYNSEEEDARI